METDTVSIDKLVKYLHDIHDFVGADIHVLKKFLDWSWYDIKSFLKSSAPTYHLEITSSVLPRFDIYTKPGLSSPFGHTNSFLPEDILRFIEENPDLEKLGSSSHAHSIEPLIRKKIDAESFSGRHSYAFLASRLLDLVERLIQLNVSAESAFIEYLCQCFLYDVKSQDARSRDTHSIAQLTQTDTEKLLSAIDNYTQQYAKSSVSEEPHDFLENARVNSLNFQSSDPGLAEIYAAFLSFVLYKLSPKTHHEIMPYAIVMVHFYKRHRNVVFFALDENSVTSEILHFFCGSSESPGVVSELYREHASQILSPSSHENIYSSGESHDSISDEVKLAQESVSAGLSRNEIITLVADFETVITTLSEYDLSLSTSLLLAFRNYVYLVYEVFPESTAPKDFQFIDNVVETIAAVVNYASVNEHPENNEIHEILNDFQAIQRTMSEISVSSTLLMRLTISETQNSLSFATSCLQKWNRKTLVANQLRIIYEEEYLPKQELNIIKSMFSKWHGRSSTINRLSQEAVKYHDKKTLSFHFNEHWIESILNNLKMNRKMEVFQMAKFWNIWKKRLGTSQNMESASDSYLYMSSLKQGFSFWRTKCEKVDQLEEILFDKGKTISQGSQAFLQQKLWTHWVQKLEESSTNIQNGLESLSEKLSKLDMASRKLTQKKYIEILKASVARIAAMRKFTSSQNSLLKKHYLGTWQMKIHLIKQQNSVFEKRSLALKRSVLSCWNDQLHARTLANNTSRKNSLNKFWKVWQLKKLRKHYSEAQAAKSKESFFKKWMLSYKSSFIIRDLDTRVARHALIQWNQRLQRLRSNEEKAIPLDKGRSLRDAIVLWNLKKATSKEMRLVADLNIQRKFFNLTWAKHSQIQAQVTEAENLAAKHTHDILTKVVLGASLKKWQDAYVSRYEEEAGHALEHFQYNVRDKGMLTVFFGHWKKKHLALKVHKDALEKNLEFFNNTNILKSEFLLHWVDTSRAKADALEKSVSFHQTLLYKKFLLVWYEKYMTKSRYLSEIADDHVNRREYHQMVELLRKWNLAFTKNVRRNQQTCDMFVEKWERNNLQSLFDLWLYKTRRKASADEYTIANASFGSNTSPLSRKFIGSGASLEHLDGSSYLNTPVKSQVPRLPFTPAKTTTSPTRLQETNQKIKSTKMDALTSRYKSVKRGPQPSNSKLFRSDTTSLPPPTQAISPSRLPIRPPPAPRFGSYPENDHGPDATSSPETSRFIRESSLSPEVDDSLLATAKRLQRIKPVVIPRNDSPVGFRYSPISKLRERLQSRTESPQSSSTLFDT